MLAIGYIGPINGYLAQRQELVRQQQVLDEMKATRRGLIATLNASRRDDEVERKARELGAVRPGERAFVIIDPADERNRPTTPAPPAATEPLPGG